MHPHRVVVDAEVDSLADPRHEAVTLVRLREDEDLVEQGFSVVLDSELLGEPSLHRDLLVRWFVDVFVCSFIRSVITSFVRVRVFLKASEGDL